MSNLLEGRGTQISARSTTAGPAGPTGPTGPQGPPGPVQVYVDNYGGAAPTTTPTVPSIAFDTSTPQPYEMWVWNGSAWV